MDVKHFLCPGLEMAREREGSTPDRGKNGAGLNFGGKRDLANLVDQLGMIAVSV